MKNSLIINGGSMRGQRNARIEKLINSEYGRLLREAYTALDVSVLYQSRIHGNGHIERTMLLGAMIAQALDADVHGTFGQQSALNGAYITYICEKTMEENHTVFEVTA